MDTAHAAPAVFVRGVRAALALGIVAAAACHTLASELLPVSGGYYSDNTLDFSTRSLLLGIALGSLGAVALAALVSVRLDRTAAGIEWLARLLSPLVLLPFAMPLLRRDFAEDIETAVMLGAWALALERLGRVSAAAWAEQPPAWMVAVGAPAKWFFSQPRLVLAGVVAAAAFHAWYMGTWAVWSHQRFSTYGYDLGQYDQVFTSVLKGEPLRLPTLGWDWVWGGMNGHADLGSFYMVPFYAIYPRASTLLVMQAVMLASAAVPLFLFARRRMAPQWAFGLALAWLLYAPLHGAQLYDVHMQPFGAAWTMFAIAAVDARKWVLYWVFFVLAILVREDVSIGLTMLGAYLFLSGYRPRTGFATALIAGLFFVVLRFGIMGSQPFAEMFKSLYPAGESGFGAVIKTMISNPGYTAKTLITWEKVRYVCQLFAPLAFVSLRRPMLLLLFVPGFIVTLLTTGYMPTIQIQFQYVANWATYAFVAAAIAMGDMGETGEGLRRRSAAAIAIFCASVLASIQWGAYSPYKSVQGGFHIVPRLEPTAQDYQREKDLQELMKQVPEKAKLCAAEQVLPHVTWHHDTWSMRDGLFECEYLIYSDLPGEQGASRGMTAVADGSYETFATKPGLVLAKKKAAPAKP